MFHLASILLLLSSLLILFLPHYLQPIAYSTFSSTFPSHPHHILQQSISRLHIFLTHPIITTLPAVHHPLPSTFHSHIPHIIHLFASLHHLHAHLLCRFPPQVDGLFIVTRASVSCFYGAKVSCEC